MLLIEMKNITPELIEKALKEEGLDVYIDDDKDVIIKSEQLMIAKIYKERNILKYFGSIPIPNESITKVGKDVFLSKMNRSSDFTKFSLFDNEYNSSLYFELYIPMQGWVSSEFLSGSYWKAVEEVKRAQTYAPYISSLSNKE